MSPISNATILVALIGFALGLMLIGMFSGTQLGVNAPTLALVIAAAIWFAKVAHRPDMIYSLIGVLLGVGVSFIAPQLAFKTVLEPGVAIIGAIVLVVGWA